MQLTHPDPAGAAPRLSREERKRFEGYLAEMLAALGLPAIDEDTRRTPARLLQAWVDATCGYEGDPKLVTLFEAERNADSGTSGQVVEGPIPFTALCEHHVLPFFGDAWIGYVAGDRLIGLSKLTRLARLHSRRFTMQERMGHAIARELMQIVGAHGAAVRLTATHMCTRMRGVCEAHAATTTTAWCGTYERSDALRHEFLTLCVRP